MTQVEKIDKQWTEQGTVSTGILKGDLYETHKGLYKLATLSELSHFYISREKIVVIIPKEKPEEMVSKVLWLSCMSPLAKVTAVKKGIDSTTGKQFILSFDEVNDLVQSNMKYKSLDSRQRN